MVNHGKEGCPYFQDGNREFLVRGRFPIPIPVPANGHRDIFSPSPSPLRDFVPIGVLARDSASYFASIALSLLRIARSSGEIKKLRSSCRRRAPRCSSHPMAVVASPLTLDPLWHGAPLTMRAHYPMGIDSRCHCDLVCDQLPTYNVS